jgi:hypothetical protein
MNYFAFLPQNPPRQRGFFRRNVLYRQPLKIVYEFAIRSSRPFDIYINAIYDNIIRLYCIYFAFYGIIMG